MSSRKFLTEITFLRNYENYTETAVYKILLPFKYAVIFCDLISKNGKLDFGECFEEDLDFQEIIYESYDDIDDDDFETEVEYLKENARKCPDIIREIFDVFLGTGKITSNGSGAGKLLKETYVIHDLTGEHTDRMGTL